MHGDNRGYRINVRADLVPLDVNPPVLESTSLYGIDTLSFGK